MSTPCGQSCHYCKYAPRIAKGGNSGLAAPEQSRRQMGPSSCTRPLAGGLVR
jgi:hypothetical protein